MLQLCNRDPLLDALRTTFGAQPIRVPEARVAPLVVFQMAPGARFRYLGRLRELVTSSTAGRLNELKIERARMLDLSGKRSGAVDTKFGLEILEGFLKGFNLLGSLPSISAQFSHVSGVFFQFQDVQRASVSPAAIGSTLRGKVFQVDNALIADALHRARRVEFFIVDSVIESRGFSMAASSEVDVGFELNVAEIQELVSLSAAATVSSNTKRDLVFTSRRHLPFAFTCFRVSFEASGGDVRMSPYVGPGAYARPPNAPEAPPRHAVLTSRPGLLDWD